jgi:rare lipoprotein A (RlpA)-like double-psi beta-barrel protein
MAKAMQASWFDCSASSPGACGTCRSGNHQCAVQNLRGFPGCFCGCQWVQASCGQHVSVTDPCTGRSVCVTVADHGPGACGGSPAPDCRGYRTRLIDLTRAAFSAIAPLDQGLASVVSTVNGC